VSWERARDIYRVAIDPGRWAVDNTETVRLRADEGDRS
jgi:hypothetical protein